MPTLKPARHRILALAALCLVGGRHHVAPLPTVPCVDLARYAFRSCKTDHHPAGTCKMGKDRLAVVGTDLKVHGVDGLRVCDSSVMPLLVSSNTNAPTVMIGEKGADIIRGRPALTAAPPNALDPGRAFETA